MKHKKLIDRLNMRENCTRRSRNASDTNKKRRPRERDTSQSNNNSSRHRDRRSALRPRLKLESPPWLLLNTAKSFPRMRSRTSALYKRRKRSTILK